MARILVDDREGPLSGAAPSTWDTGTDSRILIGVGLVLALYSLLDTCLALYPFGLGNAEWEVGTISEIINSLPLLTVSLTAIWVGAGRSGRRRLLLTCGVGFLFLALCILGSLVLFSTNIPIALRATLGQDASQLGIKKLAAKTGVQGVLFTTMYIVAGIAAIRQFGRTGTREGAR